MHTCISHCASLEHNFIMAVLCTNMHMHVAYRLCTYHSGHFYTCLKHVNGHSVKIAFHMYMYLLRLKYTCTIYLYIWHLYALFLPSQKFNERKTALQKMSFNNSEELEKWRQVLKMEYMSSEESGMDDENEVIIVKSLPWRSVHVDQMFRRLDDKTLGEKSPQARCQMKRRVTGETSSRPMPTGDHPSWAVTGN